MTTPTRLLRASVEDLTKRRFLTDRQRETRELILASGQRVMADYGRPNIKMITFADAIQVSPGTIRHYICDLDNLLAEILRRHLREVSKAIGAVPIDAPDSQVRRRAAYHAATRTFSGAYTEAHYLLLRDRTGLPPDLATGVEQLRLGIGQALLPAHPHTVLTLLDAPDMDLAQAERCIAALAPPAAEAAAPPIMAPEAAKPEIPEATSPPATETTEPEPALTKTPWHAFRTPSQDYGPAYTAALEKIARASPQYALDENAAGLGFSSA